MSRKALFKKNLRKAAQEKSMSQSDVAAAMRLDRDQRKWLTRIWNDGLDRPNTKTMNLLCHLAIVLLDGVYSDATDFWKSDDGVSELPLKGEHNHPIKIQGSLRQALITLNRQLASHQEQPDVIKWATWKIQELNQSLSKYSPD